MIEIKRRFTDTVLFKSETATRIKEALVDAVKSCADLSGAYLVGAYLVGADLSGAYLSGADLSGADLRGADLRGAYLVGANLGDAYLRGADLGGAYLSGAYLSGADLRDYERAPNGYARLKEGATAPSIVRDEKVIAERRAKWKCATSAERAAKYRERHPEVPVVENLDRKILEVIESGKGQLEMGSWHTCETTHCRAGWAIHLAGEAGYALEHKLGDAQRAGSAIYRASTGRVPYFFDTNEGAFADIKKRAQEAT